MAARRKKTAKASTWGGARPGAGRPRRVKQRADRTIRFERAQLAALEELAGEQGVSIADLVREAVEGFLVRRKKG